MRMENGHPIKTLCYYHLEKLNLTDKEKDKIMLLLDIAYATGIEEMSGTMQEVLYNARPEHSIYSFHLSNLKDRDE